MLISRQPKGLTGFLSNNTPLPTGVSGSPGIGTLAARWDHIHQDSSGGGGGGGTASNLQSTYSCAPSIAVNDVVYFSGTDTVALANAISISTAPAIGVVVAKPTSTTATVQWAGPATGFSSLTPDATYFLATTNGQITASPASATGNILQRLGVAEDATTLFLMVDRDFVVL
jgi:hypothetical protein